MTNLLQRTGTYIQLNNKGDDEGILFGPFREVYLDSVRNVLEGIFMDELGKGRRARFLLTSKGIPYGERWYESYFVAIAPELDNVSWNWRERVEEYHEMLALA